MRSYVVTDNNSGGRRRGRRTKRRRGRGNTDDAALTSNELSTGGRRRRRRVIKRGRGIASTLLNILKIVGKRVAWPILKGLIHGGVKKGTDYVDKKFAPAENMTYINKNNGKTGSGASLRLLARSASPSQLKMVASKMRSAMLRQVKGRKVGGGILATIGGIIASILGL